MPKRTLACLAAFVALGTSTAVAASSDPETNKALGPSVGAGHYIGGQSESGAWHGCTKSDVQWGPRSFVTGQQTTARSTHKYVTITPAADGVYPMFTWKVKAGYKICGAEAFAAVSGPTTAGGQLLTWVSYTSGATSGTTAKDGKETVKVHMPKDLADEQPDLKPFAGATVGIDAFQAIAVFVKKA
jgi:hypothetical protein